MYGDYFIRPVYLLLAFKVSHVLLHLYRTFAMHSGDGPLSSYRYGLALVPRQRKTGEINKKKIPEEHVFFIRQGTSKNRFLENLVPMGKIRLNRSRNNFQADINHCFPS